MPADCLPLRLGELRLQLYSAKRSQTVRRAAPRLLCGIRLLSGLSLTRMNGAGVSRSRWSSLGDPTSQGGGGLSSLFRPHGLHQSSSPNWAAVLKGGMAKLLCSGILDHDWSWNLVRFNGRPALAVCVWISMSMQHGAGFECAVLGGELKTLVDVYF